MVELDLLGLDRRADRRTVAGSRSRRCTARLPGDRPASSARVTMPTGLVKSTIQASGLAPPDLARRCRARPARCAAPWRDRRRRWSPGRRSRTRAARSRPRCGSPARRPAAGAAPRRRRRPPARGRRASSPSPGAPAGGGSAATPRRPARAARADGSTRTSSSTREVVAQPGEPVDELGGVRRPTADDCELHPLTPVSVTPSMNAFCAKKNTMITGAITSRVAAIVRFQFVWWALLNDSRP